MAIYVRYDDGTVVQYEKAEYYEHRKPYWICLKDKDKKEVAFVNRERILSIGSVRGETIETN